MSCVLNARKVGKTPHPDAVYIGRPSPWGNPFEIGRHGSRSDVIALYIAYLHDNPELVARARQELEGKDLVCWCAPAPCHGDILLSIAAGDPLPERAAEQSEFDF